MCTIKLSLSNQEVNKMSRSKSLMSENLKEEIAKELGVYDTVKQEGGWGNVSKTCGNIVSKAIEIANRSVEKQLYIIEYFKIEY